MIRIQEEDFDPGVEIAALGAGRRDTGAVVSFTGLVRDLNDDVSIQAMTLEHYPGMTEKAISQIIDQAQARWDIFETVVIHRVGRLQPTERIVFIAVSSAHRGEAFQACEFIIDYLKTDAPFWKKEETSEGDRWVQERDGDHKAAKRWSEK